MVRENAQEKWKKIRGNDTKSGWFFRVFPWVWLVTAFCATFLVLSLYGRPYIDSDMSSEMVLADLLNREGGLLSANWWYSTELRVLCLQPFYRLGLLLFPQDWYAARMAGQMLCVLALLVSYLYVGHGLKLRNCGVWGAAALACPFGIWYLWYGLYGGYYLPHMILPLLSFGAVLQLLHSKTQKQRIFPLVLLFVTCVGSGLNGIKGLMMFYAPLFLAAIVLLALRWHEDPKSMPPQEAKLVVWSLFALAAAGIGYLINSKILSNTYSFLNYNELTWSPLDIGMLLHRWSEFLGLFGYLGGDSFLQPNTAIFSFSGILSAFGVLMAAAVVFGLIRLLLHWREIKSQQLIVPVLMTVILLEVGFVFSCTEGVGTVAPSHWLPIVPFVFLVLQLEGETEHFQLRFTRRIVAVAFCCSIVATSISAVKKFPTTGYVANPHLKTVCDWLVDSGYSQGYASFWNGNVLTEWSSGQLEMWVVETNDKMRIYQWLQKSSHETPPQGKVFFLTTDQELEDIGLSALPAQSRVVYEDTEAVSKQGRYLVLEYEDADALMTAVDTVKASSGAG